MRRVVILAVIAAALSQRVVTAPLPEDLHSSVGYPTVGAALAALRAKPGVQIKEQQGWTIVSDTESGSPVLWSFTPPGHPAHPSAVKRFFTKSAGGGTDLEMKVLCEADKASCDALVREFQALNDRLIAEVQNKTQSHPAGRPSTGTEAHEEINVTSDSAPGWLPSADQRAQVPRVTQDFLAALDSGQYAKAYDFETEAQKHLESFDAFAKRGTEFDAKAGPVKERRIVRITWTKDPAHAPSPGVYAAVDLVSRFANIDRHCGYIVLYQSDAPAPFKVTRQEDNFMTNEDARTIEQSKSRQAVDQVWSQLARNCPNYTATTTGGK